MGGLPVSLILADGSEHPEPGKWVFVDRAVDVTTGTIRARAEFPNPKLANTNWVLRPGMFARARISLKTEKDSILVPQRAVQELQGKTFVWVVNEGNKAGQRKVTVGAEIGSDVIVLEGLKAGDEAAVADLWRGRDTALRGDALRAHPALAAEVEQKLLRLEQLMVSESVPGRMPSSSLPSYRNPSPSRRKPSKMPCWLPGS